MRPASREGADSSGVPTLCVAAGVRQQQVSHAVAIATATRPRCHGRPPANDSDVPTLSRGALFNDNVVPLLSPGQQLRDDVAVGTSPERRRRDDVAVNRRRRGVLGLLRAAGGHSRTSAPVLPAPIATARERCCRWRAAAHDSPRYSGPAIRRQLSSTRSKGSWMRRLASGDPIGGGSALDVAGRAAP